MTVDYGADFTQEELYPDSMAWPDTFTVILAVDRRGHPFLVNWPDAIDDWVQESCPEDNGFSNMPTTEGLYRCVVKWSYHGYEHMTFEVVKHEYTSATVIPDDDDDDESWHMTIPVQTTDSDMLLSAALHQLDLLTTEVERLRTVADAARLVVDEDRWVNQVADYRFRVMGPRDLDLSNLRKALEAQLAEHRAMKDAG